MNIKNEKWKEILKQVKIEQIADTLGITKQALYYRQRTSKWKPESVIAFVCVVNKLICSSYTEEEVIDGEVG